MLTRPKTNINREYTVDGDTVKIVSHVVEEMDKNKFFEVHTQKLRQLENLRNQYHTVKAQIRNIENELGPISDAEKAELMKLKEQYDKIRKLDKLETLKQNAQGMEIDLERLEKDAKETQEQIRRISESVSTTAA